MKKTKVFYAVLIMLVMGFIFNSCISKKMAITENIRINDALTVIHSRKSVRNYLDKLVNKEQLEILLKAGMAAPTARDCRPWVFVAVTDRNKLKILAEGMVYGKMLEKAGAAIVVCGDIKKALTGEGQQYWIQDCSACTENILLAAEAIGLGAVWLGVYPDVEKIDFIRATLGISETVIPLNVISIGYPTGEDKPKNKFDPANIHWNRW